MIPLSLAGPLGWAARPSKAPPAPSPSAHPAMALVCRRAVFRSCHPCLHLPLRSLRGIVAKPQRWEMGAEFGVRARRLTPKAPWTLVTHAQPLLRARCPHTAPEPSLSGEKLPPQPSPRHVPYVWCFVDLYQYRRVQSVPCRTRARESTQQLAGKCESVGCSSAPPRTHGRGTIVDRRVGCSSVVAGRCIHRFEGLRRSLLRMAGTGVSTAAPRDASGHGGVQHHGHQVRLDFTHAMRGQAACVDRIGFEVGSRPGAGRVEPADSVA